MRRGKTRQVKGVPGRYNIVYAYADEGVGLAAGELAIRFVNYLVQPTPDFDFTAELEKFIKHRRAERVRARRPRRSSTRRSPATSRGSG